MRPGFFVAVLLSAGASLVRAAPAGLEDKVAGDRGSYTVSRLGSRKQAVIGKGGGTLDLTIAMLETENMGTDYAYGGLILILPTTVLPLTLLYQATTSRATPPTLASSSRTGACCALVPHLLHSLARAARSTTTAPS